MLRCILWIFSRMIRMMEGWLDRIDGDWEIINNRSTTPNGEEAEPWENSGNHEKSNENDEEKNQCRAIDNSACVVNLEKHVQCSSVLQSD